MCYLAIHPSCSGIENHFNLYPQTFIGSECLYQMLKAIWPSIARVPNHLSDNSNVTTVGECHVIYRA